MENKVISKPCDICGDGQLHHKISNEPIEYKGIKGHYSVHYSQCDVCKAESADSSDMLFNKRELVRFKKKVDQVPFGVEIVAMRKQLNMTQQVASEIFGGGPVAFSKYENDDLVPDEAMVGLLKLALAYPDIVLKLARLKNVVLSPQVVSNDKFQYEVITSHWIKTKSLVVHKGSDLTYVNLLGSDDKSNLPRKTISSSSGGVVKKIKSGGSLWTVQ